jgi:hypothetical protein
MPFRLRQCKLTRYLPVRSKFLWKPTRHYILFEIRNVYPPNAGCKLWKEAMTSRQVKELCTCLRPCWLTQHTAGDTCCVLRPSSQAVQATIPLYWWCNRDFFFFFCDTALPSGPAPSRYRGFTVTLRHTTLGRTSLDEWSARRRDLYPTTCNTHKRQISVPSAWFEPIMPAGERLQTHTLDGAVTGIVRSKV